MLIKEKVRIIEMLVKSMSYAFLQAPLNVVNFIQTFCSSDSLILPRG